MSDFVLLKNYPMTVFFESYFELLYIERKILLN